MQIENLHVFLGVAVHAVEVTLIRPEVGVCVIRSIPLLSAYLMDKMSERQIIDFTFFHQCFAKDH